MLCPLAGENGGDGEAGGSAQPLVQITLVKQGGGPRGQVYYPFISFRIARTLQVSCFLSIRARPCVDAWVLMVCRVLAGN